MYYEILRFIELRETRITPDLQLGSCKNLSISILKTIKNNNKI